MTKRKSIVSKVLLAIVALTLISCCFLGSTFARYTSGGTGSAGTSVALWNVALEPKENVTTTFKDLSPSMKDYTQASNADVTLTSTPIAIATITNSGDVGAKVTVTVGAQTVAYSKSDFATSKADANITENSDLVTEENVAKLFTVTLYYGTNATWDEGYERNVITSGEALTDTLENGEQYTIFASVTWTTKYSTSNSDGVKEDVLDTFAGEYVKSVSWAITFTADQATESGATA